MLDKGKNEGRRPVGLAGIFLAFMAGFGLAPSRRTYVPRGPSVAEAAAPAAEVVADAAPLAIDRVLAEPVAIEPVDAPATPVPTETDVALRASEAIEPRRAVPTPLGARVLVALRGQSPLRKHEVAALVGIGRGSANRIVDRLVDSGWLRAVDGRFTLS